MNALKLAALFAVTAVGSYSFADVSLENTANYFAIDFTVHTTPDDHLYNFVLGKKGTAKAITSLPTADNRVDRIILNSVAKQ